MTHRRPYYVFDGSFEFRGIEWLDLEEGGRRVIFESDVAQVGTAAMVNFGRDIETQQRAAVDAGVFPKGEHPKGHLG